MLDLFIVAGQSNAGGHGPAVALRDDSLPAPYVPGYAQTLANEWTGAPAASWISGYQYRKPNINNSLCKFKYNNTGQLSGIFSGYGNYILQAPLPPSGNVGEVGAYALELAFGQKHLQTFPNTPIAILKQQVGGSSLRHDWTPYTVLVGPALGGTSNTITFDANTGLGANVSVGALIKTQFGDFRTVTAYDSANRIATVNTPWTVVPTSSTMFGIERLQTRILRLMLADFATELNTLVGVGNWRYAALLWMQGESGAHSATTAANDSMYLSDFRAWAAYIRTLTRPDLPIGIGMIGDNWINTNPSLIAAGYPYAAIDYSYNFTDGRIAAPDNIRASYLAGATNRRITQSTLATDQYCFGWNNDGNPVRPPYALTSALNDLTAYHWGGPGHMASGERAFQSYYNYINPSVGGSGKLVLSTPSGKLVVNV